MREPKRTANTCHPSFCADTFLLRVQVGGRPPVALSEEAQTFADSLSDDMLLELMGDGLIELSPQSKQNACQPPPSRGSSCVPLKSALQEILQAVKARLKRSAKQIAYPPPSCCSDSAQRVVGLDLPPSPSLPPPSPPPHPYASAYQPSSSDLEPDKARIAPAFRNAR